MALKRSSCADALGSCSEEEAQLVHKVRRTCTQELVGQLAETRKRVRAMDEPDDGRGGKRSCYGAASNASAGAGDGAAGDNPAYARGFCTGWHLAMQAAEATVRRTMEEQLPLFAETVREHGRMLATVYDHQLASLLRASPPPAWQC